MTAEKQKQQPQSVARRHAKTAEGDPSQPRQRVPAVDDDDAPGHVARGAGGEQEQGAVEVSAASEPVLRDGPGRRVASGAALAGTLGPAAGFFSYRSLKVFSPRAKIVTPSDTQCGCRKVMRYRSEVCARHDQRRCPRRLALLWQLASGTEENQRLSLSSRAGLST
jgi:hypothetical protein